MAPACVRAVSRALARRKTCVKRAACHTVDVALYNRGNRELQDRFDTRRLADRIEERIVRDHIDADDRAFIEARDMFFIATTDDEGRPQCSYKGGDPGFVRVLDERTIAFPRSE